MTFTAPVAGPKIPWPLLKIGAWLAALALLLPLAAGLEGRLDVDAQVEGSGHARTEELVAGAFDASIVDPLLLVVEGLDPADFGDGADTLDGILASIRAGEPQARDFSYLDSGDALYLGADGNSTVVLVSLPGPAADRAATIERIRAAVDAFVESEERDLRVSWTSESMINDELREISARDANTAELRVLPLALVVLFLAFGSASASLTPIVTGFLTVALARGALALIDGVLPLSLLTANVASMLGLALAVDYGLLVVSRFREELARGDARAAAAATARRSGRTLVLSGLGVGIAFAALLLVPVNEVRSIAVAGLVVVTTAVAVSTTLAPAILALAGSRIDLFLPVRRRLSSAGGRIWSAWGGVVFARPILLLVLGGAPLVALALACSRLDISMPRGDWLPASTSAGASMATLDRIDRTGLLQTIVVTAAIDAPGGVQSEAGWRSVAELAEQLAADPRVEAVRSIYSLAGGGADGLERLELVPEDTRRMFVSADGRLVLLAVIPRAELELHELSQLVRDTRAAPPIAGVAALSVGGAPALTADYQDAIARWFAPVAAVILIATFVVLAVGLRSLLLPLKAVALNLLSVGAALGAMTLVFQDGYGASALGLPGGWDGVFPIVPVLAFSIVFGLSMDYEVFLFGRVVEAHGAGATDRDAMQLGLRATAGVISGAAAIMIIVFGAFTLGEFLLMKMLGFSLAAAILIDAALVRLVIGPALFAIAGRWNWWPGR